MMRRTALLATILAIAAATPAWAASTLTINGAGFGHGIGMSQYGAAGYAEHGWDHVAILQHYFQGTELGQTDTNRVIRVLLQQTSTPRFTNVTNAGTKKLDPAQTYSARANGARVDLLNSAGRKVATFDAPLRVTNAADAPVKLLGTGINRIVDGSYRGWLEFRVGGGSVGGLLAINAVGLEQYVAGVIGAEAIPSWPAEALEAQAVATRGYAITTTKGGDLGYDLTTDTSSQVYRGVAAETPSTNKAANATAGEVMTYDGDPITTFFFSTSGGHTENVENVWGGTPKPYLVGVDDPYDDISPYHRWGPIRMPMSTATARLGSLVKGSLKKITVTKRGTSPRIVKATVLGTGGTTVVSGDQLKAAFGLRDTWMTFNGASATVEVPPSTTDPAPTTTSTAPAPGKSTSGGAKPALRVAPVPITRPRVTGDAWGAKPGTPVKLQARRDGRWRTVATTHLGTTQRYKITLPGAGRYRITVGDAPGPIVRLRSRSAA